MKKQFVFFVGIIFSLSALAQVPQAINYQAVYKDASTGIYKKSGIAVIITITQDTPDGIEVFTETHSTSTNENGLFTLQIGSVNQEDFLSINWADGPYFLGVNVNGTDFGTSQILSVPYAFLAQDVINKDDADADPTNELQTISINEHIITLSHGGGEITLLDKINDADSDPTNEIQELSIVGNELSLSRGGGTIEIPYGTVPDTAQPIPIKYRGGIRYVLPYVITISKPWSNITDIVVGTTDDDGELNTERIINQDGHTNSAAKVCADLVAYGKNDWYLPSLFELRAVYHQSYLIPRIGTLEGSYWSSTEYSINGAWNQSFVTGTIHTDSKTSTSIRVRCIRKD